MTNSLVEDNRVALDDIDEGVLVESDMSGTHLNEFLVKIRHKACAICSYTTNIGQAYMTNERTI